VLLQEILFPASGANTPLSPVPPPLLDSPGPGAAAGGAEVTDDVAACSAPAPAALTMAIIGGVWRSVCGPQCGGEMAWNAGSVDWKLELENRNHRIQCTVSAPICRYRSPGRIRRNNKSGAALLRPRILVYRIRNHSYTRNLSSCRTSASGNVRAIN